MNSRPQFDDPWKAARVSTFMEDAQRGRWRIIKFTISEKEAALKYAMAFAEGGQKEERELRASRTVTPGEYVCLQRTATPDEIRDIDTGAVIDGGDKEPDPTTGRRYVPIMSDTPSEIREHKMAIEDATGDVVITGLGLGCIVSALLAKPDVNTITVVEIDRDVIALTGPYYADEPRVTIVNADAIAFAHMASSGDVVVKPLQFLHTGDPLGNDGSLPLTPVGMDSTGRQGECEVAPHHLYLTQLLSWKDAALQQIADSRHVSGGACSPNESWITAARLLGTNATTEAALDFVKQWSVVVACGDLSARCQSSAAVSGDAEVTITEEVAAKLGGPNLVDEIAVDIPGTHGDLYYDYHWADIWSHIADRNLDDDSLAEHGISYETMFNAYEPITDQQEAWAWHEARAMVYFKEQAVEQMAKWAAAFVNGSDAQRLHLLIHFHVVQHLPEYNVWDEIPEDLFNFIVEHMEVEKLTQRQIKARGGLHVMAAEIESRAAETLDDIDVEPMGRPNEAPEANVAKV